MQTIAVIGVDGAREWDEDGSACCRYENGTVTLKAGNALDDPALEEFGPFDAIHVGAAAPDLPQVLALITPSQLLRLLKL